MKYFLLWTMICLLVNPSIEVKAQDVLTQHNDLSRTGWNSNETILNTTNVNTNNFGIIFNRNVDDAIISQPLVVTGLNIPSVGIKNVVFVTTVNNSVYAFDADDGAIPPYWQLNYTHSPLATAVVANAALIHPSLCDGIYFDLAALDGNMGILGTPVIDKQSGTMYFITKVVKDSVDNHPYNSSIPDEEYTYTSTGFHQFLHAVDITTGAEKPGSPVEITASYTGTGDGNVANTITFDPRRQFNRAGLVLSKGIVYVAFAAHCDDDPCHGWLLGYRATDLHQQIVYNTTPNDGRGGIWMSGTAPAVDTAGSIYLTTGNSLNDDASNANNQVHNNFTTLPSVPANRGESVIKLTPNTKDNTASSLTIASFFTPFNYLELNDNDLDLPIQVMLIPNTTVAITGCKNDTLYVMDRANLGGYNLATNNVLQQLDVGGNQQAYMHSNFAYFGGDRAKYFYQFSENTSLQAFPLYGNTVGTPIISTLGGGPQGGSGGYMSTSSNLGDPTTGILWITQAISGCNAAAQSFCKGILRAVQANDINTELWNSNLNAADNYGNFAKMSPPTIANGKVYVPTYSKKLAVYGLLTSSRCVNNISQGKPAFASTGIHTLNGCCDPMYAVDGSPTTRWSSDQGLDDQWIYVDLGAEYDICQVTISWETALGRDFNIDVSDDAVTWTTVDAETGNTSFSTEFDGQTTGRYVRMHGIHRGTVYGYSIWEMKVFGQPAASCIAPSNLKATNVTETSATLGWQSVAGANGYQVRYQPNLESSWIYRTVTTNSLPITALDCGTTYNFTVQAVCASSQSLISAGGLSADNCSAPCGPLITRYFHTDIGDIGAPGTTCYDGSNVYTLSGSGTDIGSDSDQFQIAFIQEQGDLNVTAKILQQDQVSGANNKLGIMIRDSISNTSAFVFLGSVSNGGDFVFSYRTSSGGPTTSVSAGPHPLPYWVKIDKLGNQFSGFISPDGVSWTPVGGPVSLGFGNVAGIGSNFGMAITSNKNAVLSTGQIGRFSVDAGNPLPIKLLSFTAENINDAYTDISWSTAMEQNVRNFEVQRSKDGAHFNIIDTLSSAGNSNVTLRYHTTDNSPLDGLNLYRLNEVDNDGKFSYSAIVPVQFGKQGIPVMYPNPATTEVTIVSSLNPMTDITLYDASGKTLQTVQNSHGTATIKLNTSTLSTGIYVVKIKTANQVYEQKLFKQ